MNSNRLKTAYSLLELSVVLAVIGLIIGAIVIGKDLIDSAKIRNTLADLNKYQSAISTFRELYSKFPGDYDEASTNLASVATDGDGNGYINESYQSFPSAAPASISTTINTTTVGNEFVGLFHHLYLANLAGNNFTGDFAAVQPGSNIPALATGNGGMILYHSHGDLKLYWHLGIISATDSDLDGFRVLTPAQSFKIDLKLDDGKPLSGSVLAIDAIDEPVFNEAGNGEACIIDTTDPKPYSINWPKAECQLRIFAE